MERLVEVQPDHGAFGAGFGAVIGASALWLANRLVGKAAMQTALNQMAQTLLAEMRAENAGLRRTLMAERAASDAARTALHGEIDNLHQVVESLERVLRANGIPIPERSGRLPQQVIMLPGHIGEDDSYG